MSLKKKTCSQRAPCPRSQKYRFTKVKIWERRLRRQQQRQGQGQGLPRRTDRWQVLTKKFLRSPPNKARLQAAHSIIFGQFPMTTTYNCFQPARFPFPIPSRAISSHPISCNVIPPRPVQYHPIPSRAISSHPILCNIIPPVPFRACVRLFHHRSTSRCQPVQCKKKKRIFTSSPLHISTSIPCHPMI